MPRNDNGTFTLKDGSPVCPPDYVSNTTMEDIGEAIADTPTRTEVTLIVQNGTANCTTASEVAALITASTSDCTTSAEVTTLIEAGTTNFITSAEVGSLVETEISDLPRRTEIASLIASGTANFATSADLLPAGTVMPFYQAAAPTGWSKVITSDNTAIRISNNTGGQTGGSSNFTTVFASHAPSGTTAGHALTVAQMPAHTHAFDATPGEIGGPGGGAHQTKGIYNLSTSTGGNEAHSHPFTADPIDLRVKYVDMILCSKDA